ncbi:SDR family NAD(P)-dependent oxidoreductase [Actinomadura chibensis]|uniref:Probable oxidoreductase n=1 Tax=Actinomadura chibensis TaxID=392828 RepID=A0A5D0NCP2_9ACTN|nr:SDR family NAD(P)-dependent oxidoreductase [Actinomadura chibensis]TYB42284.1 SDR family NAD(P)-dependent oxidoreductase [Actinomadura chibensis]
MGHPGERTFDRTSTAAQVVAGHDLAGREAIVTGGASGIGLATARALAGAGARVVIAGRDPASGEEAAARLRKETGNDLVVFRRLDLGSLASVRAWTRAHVATGRPLDILVDNAGVMAPPLIRTEDGFESQFGINHLGHFAFTTGLLPALRAAGKARVVVLSSRAHRRGDVDLDDPNYERSPYDPWEAYGRSKTANALFAVALDAREFGAGITANAVMPGAIMTGLQRHISPADLRAMGWAGEDGSPAAPAGWKTPEQGAATSVWAAVAPELDGVGGQYLEDCAVATAWTRCDDPPAGHYLPYARDPARAERLWTLSEALVSP